ncbi:MAG: hypothetical protein IJ969_02330, partial [Anaerotignum sp.]|nr:hypothetical protein [Anaerotignum sp.]
MNNTFLGAGSLLTASSGTVLNHIQVDDYGLLELEAYAKLCGEMLLQKMRSLRSIPVPPLISRSAAEIPPPDIWSTIS